MLSSESLVVYSLTFFTHVIIQYMYECSGAGEGKAKNNYSLCYSLSLARLPSSLCSLSPPPHHLSVSHHCEGKKPRSASQPDLFNGLRIRGVFARLERREDWDKTLCLIAYLTSGLNEEVGKLDKIHGRHMALICKQRYTYLSLECSHSCQPSGATLWSWHYRSIQALIPLFFFSVSPTLSLALSPSLQPSGLLARQPWGV